MNLQEKIDFFSSEIPKDITVSRYEHSIRVAKISAKLARVHGLDPNAAYLAGILHDTTKQKTRIFHIEIFMRHGFSFEDIPEEAYHPFSAFYYLQERYDFTEMNILSAVKNHTLGGDNLPILDRILCVADFLGSDYAARNPNYGEWMEKTYIDLNYGIALKSSNTICDLASKFRSIHPNTIRMYESAIRNTSI